MKSYNEIMADIKELKQIDVQQLEINFTNKITDMPPAVWMEYKQSEEYKKHKTEINAAYKQNDFNNLLKKILKKFNH